MMRITYVKRSDGKKIWCNTHNRWADYIRSREGYKLYIENCCNPSNGGIMMPCFTVDVTDILEIDDDNES